MVKRIFAITVIFLFTTFAWMVLGATIFQRTYDSAPALDAKVVSNWGAPHAQSPPSASYTEIVRTQEESTVDGKKVVKTADTEVEHMLPLEGSNIDAGIDLEHRQKGLLWYSTYKVAFAATYAFRNPSTKDEEVTFRLSFPAERAIYDDLVFTVDGQSQKVENNEKGASASVKIAAGQTATLKVGYRSQGLQHWYYNFGEKVSQVRNFKLRMRTNFKDIDFPENTLSPTEKREQSGGWELLWNYTNLLSGFQIGMAMPEKLQPGPLAGKISFFAPVSLFFFFFLMFIITTLRRIEIHPMNYFFLAAAFFAFHLLLAYLVDHISIHVSFVIASVVSIFLVVSYLRLVVGLRFAMGEAALAQAVYLVAFSYAFFFKGYTGLAITIGSIITLFVVMQATGRIKWAERFAPPPTKEANSG